jgi:transcriptional regulator with GAF, ATPase, and Fis domain
MQKVRLNAKEILQTFLSSLLKLFNVERGSIWLRRGEYYLCVKAMGDQFEKIEGVSVAVSEPSIVGWVVENRRLTIAKAGHDSRHFYSIEQKLRLKSNIILCFPLIIDEEDVFGAIQLIDTSEKGDRINLDKTHLEVMENIVNICSVAIIHYNAYFNQLHETKQLKEVLADIRKEKRIVGQDNDFLEELEKAKNFAKSDFPILITGESGTGKEIIAQKIHHSSKRVKKAFMVQNCSAIPDSLLESELFGHKKGAFTGAHKDKIGLFEAADGGTVFLDEIGDMPMNLQARILRIIQEGEIKPVGGNRVKHVDVRILSATNIDLVTAVREKKFRQDLYYRLNVLPVHLAPLRKRKGDIPLLIDYFINRESKRAGIALKRFSHQAMSCLTEYPWRGNIRELENFVKQIIVISKNSIIELDDLPANYLFVKPEEQPAVPVESQINNKENHPEKLSFSGYTWKEVEQMYVKYLLESNKWNVTKASQQAGLKRSTFDSRMKKLGFSKKD